MFPRQLTISSFRFGHLPPTTSPQSSSAQPSLSTLSLSLPLSLRPSLTLPPTPSHSLPLPPRARVLPVASTPRLCPWQPDHLPVEGLPPAPPRDLLQAGGGEGGQTQLIMALLGRGAIQCPRLKVYNLQAPQTLVSLGDQVIQARPHEHCPQTLTSFYWM